MTLLPPGRSAAPAGKPSFVVFLVDDMGIDQAVVPAAQRSYGYIHRERGDDRHAKHLRAGEIGADLPGAKEAA